MLYNSVAAFRGAGTLSIPIRTPTIYELLHGLRASIVEYAGRDHIPHHEIADVEGDIGRIIFRELVQNGSVDWRVGKTKNRLLFDGKVYDHWIVVTMLLLEDIQ